MFCPNCDQPNPADSQACVRCQQDTSFFRQRVFIGRQYIFVQADEQHPVALKVDDTVQAFRAPTILSRHQHAVSFGDEPIESRDATGLIRDTRRDPRTGKRPETIWPLPDQPRLPNPSLELLTLVTDRKIYRPNTEATFFIVAPDAGGSQVALEVQLAGQKVYEAQVPLNREGLALHPYTDLKEGEYTAIVTLSDPSAPAIESVKRTECTFSVAEFTLSPLVATLDNHRYSEQRLTFTLKLLLLSIPYSGPVELGLGCQVCGERVVATQKVDAVDGLAKGDFDVSRHGGPFYVQLTTPDGNTATVSFPGTGAVEREHISVNPLGQTAEMGLLPWDNAQSLRGFYIGSGEVNMTPLTLESVHAIKGSLRAATDVARAQIVVFDPRAGASHIVERRNIARGQAVEFDIGSPYGFFTVGAFAADKPFEGWGIVFKPLAFDAVLSAPQSAQPGETIEIHLEVDSSLSPGKELEERETPTPAFCWLLVYDARLEHESPLPKLARRIYESARDATANLSAGPTPSAQDLQWFPPGDVLRLSALSMTRASMGEIEASSTIAEAAPTAMAIGEEAFFPAAEIFVEAPLVALAPTRMEFPELAYSELFYMEGRASRTVRLGDQIGTWRVRAYVFRDADYRELTSDLQADKPLYAELDLPAIASPGDDITVAVNYHTREPAELVIATPFGEIWAQVVGGGTERFAIQGPGRVEARIQNQVGVDWTVRDIAPPGVQKVTSSRLMILDKGQAVQGERVVVYASMGQVLKDTITALIGYPFG